MRRRNVDELSRADGGPDIGVVDESISARSMLVQRFGASCAAWIVAKHRTQLHTTGIVDMVIPTHAELPMWFALAVAFLRERAGWNVEEVAGEDAAIRTFRLRWLRKLPYTQASA